MLEPDWNTAALNEYQNRQARQEEEPPLDWQGHRWLMARPTLNTTTNSSTNMTSLAA